MSETSVPNLDELDAAALRALARHLMGELQERDQVLNETRTVVERQAHDIQFKETRIQQLTHEIAILRRYRFGKKSEHLGGVQGLLLEDAVDADIAAIEQELIDLGGPQIAQRAVSHPKRQALPAELPRIEVRHEPDSTTCTCGCQLQRIGECHRSSNNPQLGSLKIPHLLFGDKADGYSDELEPAHHGSSCQACGSHDAEQGTLGGSAADEWSRSFGLGNFQATGD